MNWTPHINDRLSLLMEKRGVLDYRKNIGVINIKLPVAIDWNESVRRKKLSTSNLPERRL